MQKEMYNLFTIRTYDSSMAANFDRNLLEKNGIKAYLQNESMAATLSKAYGPMSSIRLQVSEDKKEEALKLLEKEGFVFQKNSNGFRIANLIIILIFFPIIIPVIPILYLFKRKWFEGSEIVVLISFILSLVILVLFTITIFFPVL